MRNWVGYLTLWAVFFFFNDTATTEIYTLPLHAALPISGPSGPARRPRVARTASTGARATIASTAAPAGISSTRSEEHTSELQSRQYLVCRLLLEKKNKSLLF